jgi:hypothetical protein
MVVVFHDAQKGTANEEVMRKNYVEYGRRLAGMVDGFEIFHHVS